MTLEERTAHRQKIISKWGFDPTIPEATRDAIVSEVDKHWVILAEEFTCHRLTLTINPKGTTKARYNAESELMKLYGNPPHNLATDFTGYRLTFLAV